MTIDDIGTRNDTWRPSRRNWDERARVRCAPRHAGRVQRSAGGALFAAALEPHVAHPFVQQLGDDAVRVLLRRALARYLHRTTVLEIRVVNEVAANIASGPLGAFVPDHARVDALRIHCDESYHALVATQLLVDFAGGESLDTPAFATRLDAICREHAQNASDEMLLRTLFTVVSETVISANLRHLARSNDVIPELNEFVSDHASDEAWHAVYFDALFRTLWPRLSPTEHARFGPLLAELACAFLAPDIRSIERDLACIGIGSEVAARIVADSYDDDAVRAEMARASRPFRQCVKRAGALIDSTRAAFVAAGLVEEGT